MCKKNNILLSGVILLGLCGCSSFTENKTTEKPLEYTPELIAKVSATSATDIAVADFDGDGDQDIVSITDFGHIDVIEQSDTGYLQPVRIQNIATANNAHSVLAYAEHKGNLPDIYISTDFGVILRMNNNCNLHFSEPERIALFPRTLKDSRLEVKDMDGDSIDELIGTNDFGDIYIFEKNK